MFRQLAERRSSTVERLATRSYRVDMCVLSLLFFTFFQFVLKHLFARGLLKFFHVICEKQINYSLSLDSPVTIARVTRERKRENEF